VRDGPMAKQGGGAGRRAAAAEQGLEEIEGRRRALLGGDGGGGFCAGSLGTIRSFLCVWTVTRDLLPCVHFITMIL
jgi:hypothetical protein